MATSPAKEAPRYAPLRPPCRDLPPRRRRALKVLPVIEPRRRRTSRGERLLTVARIFNGRASLPMIRIRGAWLRKLGFSTGARIVIEARRGQLVITLAGEE